MNSFKLLIKGLILMIFLASCNTSDKPSNKKGKLIKNKEVEAEASLKEAVHSIPKPIENPDIYYLTPVHLEKGAENSVFISLSDSYYLSDHPDSTAIPDVSEMPFDSVQYFSLKGKYRKQFLSKTGLSENDQLFVFNYSTGKTVSFPVRKLEVSALISIYESEDDAPFNQNNYMIGFSIDKSKLNAIGSGYYSDVLVAVGEENPFNDQKIKAISWRKISTQKFPAVKFHSNITRELKEYAIRETFDFETDTLHYFVQELTRKKTEYTQLARHLVIVNKTSRKIELEKLYVEGESIGMAPLNGMNKEYPENSQWTGKLFKNRNPVIFGFVYASFGCTAISFIGKSQSEIYTKCDNRH